MSDVRHNGFRFDDAGALRTSPAATDSTGTAAFDPDSLAHAATYNATTGLIDTLTVGPDISGNSYRKTFTWTNGSLTNVTAWVKL